MSLGVVRGWKLVPALSQGTNFNVSAVVLPERMPVADDRQLPMFSDPERFMRLLEHIAETERLLAQRLTERAQPAPRERGPHVPQNKQLRTYAGFLRTYREMEHAVRRAGYVPTKEALYLHGGAPSVRTTTRHMTRYGLDPDLWPPSVWPETVPGASGQN